MGEQRFEERCRPQVSFSGASGDSGESAESTAAVNKSTLGVENLQLGHSRSKFSVPLSFAVGESLKDGAGCTVGHEVFISNEGHGRGFGNRLTVVKHVPLTVSGILRFTGFIWKGDELPGSSVCANKSSKRCWIKSLCLEHRDRILRCGIWCGKLIWWCRCIGADASNLGTNVRASWAYHNSFGYTER
jgi:hypothetical protein